MLDYHIHSDFSDDCAVPMKEMIEAAIEKGVKSVVICNAEMISKRNYGGTRCIK